MSCSLSQGLQILRRGSTTLANSRQKSNDSGGRRQVERMASRRLSIPRADDSNSPPTRRHFSSDSQNSMNKSTLLKQFSFSTDGGASVVGSGEKNTFLGHRSGSLWEKEKVENEVFMLPQKKKTSFTPWAIYGRCRKWLWRQLHASKIGLLWDVVQTALSIIACAFYVVETYQGDQYWILMVDSITSSIFALDYVMNLLAAKNPVLFVLHPMAIIDVLTIVPIYIRLIFNASLSKLSFFRVFRILRLLRLLRALRIFKASKILKRMGSFNEKWASNLRLFFGILCGLFAFAAIMQQLEEGEELDAGDWSFHNSMYYVIVTISTVGYGDFYPQTALGRAMCVFIIVVTLVFVPIQLTRISEIVFDQLQNKYKTPYKVKETHGHVVVLGSVNQQGFQDFLTEFFHEDHIGNRTKMVLLLPDMPEDYIKNIMNHPDYEDRLHYIRGSALVKEDMQRAHASEASAVFIFASSYEYPKEEDVANILRTLAFRHYGQQNNKDINNDTFIQINLVESKDKLISTGVQRSRVVCIEELQMSMFALGAMYPGAQAFIANLLRSYTVPRMRGKDMPQWFLDYTRGCEFEVYKIRLPDTMRNLTFTEMAIHAYLEYGLFLFGLEVEVTGGFRVVINPAGTYDGSKQKWPKHGLYGFCLARDIRETMAFQFETPSPSLMRPNNVLRHVASKSHMSGSSRRHSSVKHQTFEDDDESELPDGSFICDDYETVLQDIEISGHYLRTADGLLDDVSPQKISAGADSMVDVDVGLGVIRPKWSSGQIQSLVQPAQGEPIIKGHIIVTGSWRAQDKLIEMLRVNYRLQRPVVLLNPTKPDPELAERLFRLRHVYYIQGSAGQYDDLDRVSIYTAHSVVVFRSDKAMNQQEAHLADADTVLSVLTVRNALAKNPSLHSHAKVGKSYWMPLVCEFGFSTNIQYVEPEALKPRATKSVMGFKKNVVDEEMVQPTNRPMYASGSVFLFSILDSLLCQSYFSRRLLLVIQEFVGDEPHSSKLEKMGIRKSRFYQIAVPSVYIGFKFREIMVCFLRDFGTICLGLYRMDRPEDFEHGEMMSSAPYVVTCPHKNTVLRDNDKIFILSQSIRVIKSTYSI